MKKKRVFRLFTIVDVEEEAAYLRRMHQQGWKFVGYRYGLFHFEECQPEDVVYGIDFKEEKVDDAYLKLFREAGWEYVSTCLNFVYFHKTARDFVPGEEGQICSDKQSRLEMIQRILKRRLVPTLLCLALFLYLSRSALSNPFSVFLFALFFFFSPTFTYG